MVESKDTVKVAVRIRPLSDYEEIQDPSLCFNAISTDNQIRAGDSCFTFDHVFSPDSSQSTVYDACVEELLNSAFEGFNATILAYGQTGSGKTYTMGSSSEQILTEDTLGIIPRVIRNLFEMIHAREETEPNCTYKVFVQFLEIYGEDIRDLLDLTRTSKVSIRETRNGEVFVTGAREELVSSFEQMMKSLEDGSRNRTTAATKMNQSSSRSHAIFTVFLERTLFSEEVEGGGGNTATTENKSEKPENKATADVLEVRKCKFHFVDLAGSERAKRTGAQGLQLKEGIDINKGLLALGNVISALGDETKKGRVFVPYRDSKLTRMLQDSLGGNSKTLMICCISPAAVDYSESLNALRYANRARNIKNKPVVNRDPTLVLLDELRFALKVMASELLPMRKARQFIEVDNKLSIEMLEEFAAGSVQQTSQLLPKSGLPSAGKVVNEEQRETRPPPPNPLQRSHSSSNKTTTAAFPSSSFSSSAISSKEIQQMREKLKKSELEASEAKYKLVEAEMEVKRLMDQVKAAKTQTTEISDQLYLMQSERDYYRMKLEESTPETGHPSSETSHEEKSQVMKLLFERNKEIDRLKEELVKTSSLSLLQQQLPHHSDPAEIDTDFTTTVATLIAQTRHQLQEESRRLSAIETREKLGLSGSFDSYEEEEEALRETAKRNEIEEEKQFARRQKILSSEFQELGQSIQLKEQLMDQLIKSQQQYTIMKSYYEQKLAALSSAVDEKQKERDSLSLELQELVSQQNETALIKQREAKLRSALQQKDDELTSMKRKQEELKNLTLVQSQYSRQLNKLEADILAMKKQRIELSRTLQSEKKNHLFALNEKAKEIERLKKELSKASTEMKKLEKGKEMAENKVKDVLQQKEKEKETSFLALLTRQTEIASINLTGSTSSKTAGKFKPTKPLSIPEIATAATARAAIREINRSTHRFSSKRFLSEEELKMKKWIDQRIAEISAREAAAEALKKQYEHQLELLHKKEQLEKERSLAILHSQTSDDPNDNYRLQRSAQIEGEEGEGEDREEGEEGDKRGGGGGSQLLLSSHEEEKLLEIIEERISTVNGQLNARNQKILDIERQMNDEGEVPGSDKALEVLKRTAAGSLPAAHELIRLLFDMLVHSNKALQMKFKQLEEAGEKERSLMGRIDELQRQLISEKRAFDTDLTNMNKEYEEKLQTIFQQITTLEGGGDSHHHHHHGNNQNSNSTRLLIRPQSNSSLLSNNSGSKGMMSPTGGGILTPSKSFDPLDIQLTITLEENKFLKAQNEREALRFAQLRNKYSELEAIKLRLMRDLEEKNQQIRFLEEDRGLFKEMVEDLKAGLNRMGKDGKAVVSSVKASASQTRREGGKGSGLLYGEYLQISSDDEKGGGQEEEDDEDSASVIGQYQRLVLEIHRNKGSSLASTPTHPLPPPPSYGSSGFSTPTTVSGSVISLPNHLNSSHNNTTTGKNIYDRLTNPSNFTGYMKNVFENDLESKRKKIQQSKTSSSSSAANRANQTKRGGGGGGGAIIPTVLTEGGPPSTTNSTKGGFFGDALRSRSHDDYEMMMTTRGGGGGKGPHHSTSSQNLLSLPLHPNPNPNSRNASHSTSSHSLRDPAINNDNDQLSVTSTHSTTSSQQKTRRRSLSHVNRSDGPLMKLNLEHLSLEDEQQQNQQLGLAAALSSSHDTVSSNNTSSNHPNPNPNPTPTPTAVPTNVFTRLSSKIPTSSSNSNNRSSSAVRRKSLTTSSTSEKEKERTTSPAAWRKTSASQHQHHVQYYYNSPH